MSPATTNKPVNFAVTSHSIDGTFESCPRRFEFRHIYQAIPVTEPYGFAAEVGTAMHEALQDWTRHDDFDKACLVLLRFWPWALEEDKNTAGRADTKRTLENSILLLESLTKMKVWDEWEVAKFPDGSFAIEVAWRINHMSLGSFPHPVTGEPVFLATQGKIDWILQHKVQRDRFKAVDLKTTVLDESAQEASFRFSGQGGQYGLVLSHAMGLDWKVHGLEISYLVGEFSEFGEPNINELNYDLEPWEVYESIEAKNERLQRMISMGNKAFWPRRSHGCSFYGHPCGFLDVCHRRDPKFLDEWFSFDRLKFKIESRIYDAIWTIES